MQTAQFRWTQERAWDDRLSGDFADADVVFVFADTPYFYSPACFEDLRQRFPVAQILGCSTAGNVQGTRLSDDDVVVTAVRLERSSARLVSADVGGDVAATAAALVADLQTDGLRHIFVLLDGQLINGSELAAGLSRSGLQVTGGVAADGSRFGNTWVMANAAASRGRVVALGLYGDVAVHSASQGGWQEFGPERRVTASQGNVVFEIDGEPALALYKKYLGELAQQLPHSGLRYPLGFTVRKDGDVLVRTIMGVDEATQSLSFAAEVPQGCSCRLMRTQLDDLIHVAALAANASADADTQVQGLCLVVSCVGRRQVLGQRVEEELEAVHNCLGPRTALAGFYSYGELASQRLGVPCELHNQTLVLTTLYE